MALDFQTIVAFHRYWLFRPQKVENVELVDKTGMQEFFKNTVTSKLTFVIRIWYLFPMMYTAKIEMKCWIYEFHISYIKTAKQRKKCKEEQHS